MKLFPNNLRLQTLGGPNFLWASFHLYPCFYPLFLLCFFFFFNDALAFIPALVLCTIDWCTGVLLSVDWSMYCHTNKKYLSQLSMDILGQCSHNVLQLKHFIFGFHFCFLHFSHCSSMICRMWTNLPKRPSSCSFN